MNEKAELKKLRDFAREVRETLELYCDSKSLAKRIKELIEDLEA